VRFLLDENLSPLHAWTVRNLGHDAVSVVEIGLSGADDIEVRTAAVEQGRVLLTLDADFANVLRYPPAETPGVARLRIHPATEEAIDAMLRRVIPRLCEIKMPASLWWRMNAGSESADKAPPAPRRPIKRRTS
jgi:predicted nuclease of predicted toxin-antitoxin system